MAAIRWFLRLSTLAGGAAALMIAAAFAAPPAFATPTELYVGGGGCSDSGFGTAAQPYCTISKAASVAVAGQTVIVATGTYPEKVTVANSGSAGSPIVFRTATGATVTVTGGANGFFISSRQYITVSGFRISNTTSYGISVTSSSNIVISGNVVTGAGEPAQGQIAAGIYLSATTASTVTHNTSDSNSDHGIMLAANTSTTTVSYNEASENANGYRRNATGINVVGPNNTIIGNVVHDNEDTGLQFYPGGDNNLATLNVAYNNGDHGIDDLNVTGGRLIGNTVYHNCTSGINVEGTSGSYTLRNNIAVDNAVYPAYHGIACARRAGNIGIWDSAPATTVADSNLVWLSTSGTLYVWGSSYTSISALTAATGQEAHGLQANPLFTAAATGDLSVQAGSPAIDSADSGASGEQTADLTGAPRVDDPATANTGLGTRAYDDRGAYEFGSTVVTTQPPTAALTVTPSTGNAPLSVTANGAGSADPQGQTLSYTFDFGDGTVVGPQSQTTAGHVYANAGSYQVTLTVTNTSGLSGTATAAVVAQTPPTGSPGYISQIATNYSTSSHTSGYITVWRSTGVATGHVALLTVQLTGVSGGALSGVDSKGNTYTVAQDVADGSGNRLVVLYGMVNTALVANDTITISFPTAATYRITGDELSGVSILDGHVAASGAGASFSSGPVTTSTGPEVVFGAVGLFAGSAPSWAGGWTATSSYAVGSNYLGRAYQVPASTGTFTAAGTGSGNWLAICVTLR